MKKLALALLATILLTGCSVGRWYIVETLNGKMTEKEPRFVDYKNSCVQFDDYDASNTTHAVYMVEKINLYGPNELVGTKIYERCKYDIVSNKQ
jgi:hypothetical protein